MNRLGQSGFLVIIMAIMVFAVGVLVSNHLKPEVTSFRSSSTGIDCANTSISDGTKLTCLGGDLVIPAFIFTFVAIAGGIILTKFLT